MSILNDRAEESASSHAPRRSERLRAHPAPVYFVDDPEGEDDAEDARGDIREEEGDPSDEEWSEQLSRYLHAPPRETPDEETLEILTGDIVRASTEVVRQDDAGAPEPPPPTKTIVRADEPPRRPPRSRSRQSIEIEILDDDEEERGEGGAKNPGEPWTVGFREKSVGVTDVGDSDSVKRSIEKLRATCEGEVESLTVVRFACFLSLQPIGESDDPVLYRRCLASHPFRVFAAESLRASLHTALKRSFAKSLLLYPKHACPVCGNAVTYRPSALASSSLRGDDDVVRASHVSEASAVVKRINASRGTKIHCERKFLLTDLGLWSVVKRPSDPSPPVLVMSPERLREIASSTPVHPSFSEVRSLAVSLANSTLPTSFLATAPTHATIPPPSSAPVASIPHGLQHYAPQPPIDRRPWAEWAKRTVKAMKRYLAEAKTDALRKTGHWALSRLLEDHWSSALQEHQKIHEYLGLNPLDHYRQGPRREFSAVPKTIVTTQMAFHTRTCNEVPRLDLTPEQRAVLKASWCERKRLYFENVHRRYKNVVLEQPRTREEATPPPSPLRELEETDA